MHIEQAHGIRLFNRNGVWYTTIAIKRELKQHANYTQAKAYFHKMSEWASAWKMPFNQE